MIIQMRANFRKMKKQKRKIQTFQQLSSSRTHLLKKIEEVEIKERKRPKYTPLSKRQDRPDAALWLLKNYDNPTVFVGHDCRFAGELFMETSVKVFLKMGLNVRMSRGFVSTPMVSLAANRFNCQIGVVLTASHNPPEYNGYKLKGYFGGPLSSEKVEEVESLIPSEDKIYLNQVDIDIQIKKGNINMVDLEQMYLDRVKSSFDLVPNTLEVLKLSLYTLTFIIPGSITTGRFSLCLSKTT